MSDDEAYKPLLSGAAAWRWIEDKRHMAVVPRLTEADPTDLLRRAMKFVAENPRNHDQSDWMQFPGGTERLLTNDGAAQCGTAGCLAGWGIALHNEREGLQIVPYSARVIREDLSWVSVDDYAAYLFGITPGQAGILFAPHWSTDALQAGVDAILANPNIIADDLLEEMLGA